MRISDWSSDVCSSTLQWMSALAAKLRAIITNCQWKHSGLKKRQRLMLRITGSGAKPSVQLLRRDQEIVRESCRVRVCQYVEMPVVDVNLNTKHMKQAVRDA